VGQSFCSIFLLLLSIAIKFGSTPNTTELYQYFYASAAIIVICAVAGFLFLASRGLYHHVCDYKEQFDGYTQLLEKTGLMAIKGIPNSKSANRVQINDGDSPLLQSQSSVLTQSFAPATTNDSGASVTPEQTTLWEDIQLVLSKTTGLQVDIILCWFSTLLVQSMFTHVPSSNNQGTMSQTLVYINLFATFGGQQLNLFFSKPFHIFKNITIGLWVRAFSMIFFFFYINNSLGFVNDYVMYAYNVFYFVSGGFFTSQLYGMIAEEVPISSRTQAISVTNVSLLLGIVAGILSTMAISLAL